MSLHHTSKPDSCGIGKVAIEAYFTLWLERLEEFYEERDRRYEDRFKAQQSSVDAALAASDKLTAQAFAASKEAIAKAEEAQRSYNATHNDLTRKMDTQYGQMIPRPESDIKFKAQDEKIDEIKKDIAGLRESRSNLGGRQTEVVERRMRSEWVIGLLVGGGIALAALLIAIIELLIRLAPSAGVK